MRSRTGPSSQVIATDELRRRITALLIPVSAWPWVWPWVWAMVSELDSGLGLGLASA
jgi:hypothetical protein